MFPLTDIIIIQAHLSPNSGQPQVNIEDLVRPREPQASARYCQTLRRMHTICVIVLMIERIFAVTCSKYSSITIHRRSNPRKHLIWKHTTRGKLINLWWNTSRNLKNQKLLMNLNLTAILYSESLTMNPGDAHFKMNIRITWGKVWRQAESAIFPSVKLNIWKKFERHPLNHLVIRSLTCMLQSSVTNIQISTRAWQI